MEDFIVSARKYRPQSFETVVGQSSITQTLEKAIESNHLAQAFLFCGPRGVGKTTCARIMARRVNELTHDSGEELDFSFNIFELDAASNNSVDDIRNLIDQVRIPPQVGKFKVYIIDEVHMLSTGAFNAFLKTLEEPPSYAIFILATTEKHKVLPTILSRCQVYNFNRIEVGDMVEHLSQIAAKEGVNISSDALHIIAEKADGALRDALSIFDQMVSFAGNNITYDDVITNLNVLDYDYYFRMTDAFINADRTATLLLLHDILQKGFDGHNFVDGLSNHFRNLLFAVNKDTAQLLEVSQNIRNRYLDQTQKCDTRFLLNTLNVLSEADVNYKQSKNQRLLLEIALLKICSVAEKLTEKKNSSWDELISRDRPAQPAAPVKAAPQSPPPAPQVNEPQPVVERLPAQETVADVQKVVHADKPVRTPVAGIPVKEQQVVTTKVADEIADIKHDAPIVTKPAPATTSSGFTSRLSGLKLQGSVSIRKPDEIKPTTNGSETPDNLSVTDVIDDSRPADDFNLSHLWSYWTEYANRMKDLDKQSYFSTLMNRKPVMVDKFKIEFIVDNSIQKKYIEEDKANLLEFLRNSLNNWQIQLEPIVEETEDGGEIPYSPEDKFKKMAERNPELIKMKQMFDLDLDYDT